MHDKVSVVRLLSVPGGPVVPGPVGALVVVVVEMPASPPLAIKPVPPAVLIPGPMILLIRRKTSIGGSVWIGSSIESSIRCYFCYDHVG